MSTKTTFKRIALVTVAALGLGVLTSVAPATAVVGGTGSSTNYTSGITLGATSLTVVQASTDGTVGGVRFYVDTTNLNGTTSTADGLQTGETLTVTVTAKTATSAATSDLVVHKMSASYSGNTPTYTSAASAATTISVTSADTASPNTSWSATAKANNELNRYWFGLVPANGKAVDAGAYTIRVRLTNANNAVIDKTLTATWVSTVADAGATVTVTDVGTITTGAAFNYTTSTYANAVLKDANGGRVLLGLATIAGGTDASTTPSLDANILSSAGVVGESLSIADTGVAATDFVAGTGTNPTGNTCGVDETTACITLANSEIIANRANGVYGITDALISTAATTTASIRARLLNSAASGTTPVVIAPATSSASANTTVTATAVGLKSSDTVARTVSSNALTYNIPVTTSSVSLLIDTDAAAGAAMTSSVAWSGNYATANVSPAADTPVVNYVDANGRFTVALTNTDAVAGGTAVVTVTGFANAGSNTITLNWTKPIATTVSVTDPVSGVFVALKAATTFTVRVQDQFGNTLAGEQLQPSLSSTSSNYSATTTYAAITTGASGTATFTLTDAKAVADGTDAITFTAVSNPTVATTTYNVTYKTTIPTVSTMYSYSSQTFADSAASINTAVSSSGITGASARLTIVTARDQSKSLAANNDSAENDMVALRIRALTSAGVAATGAPVTLTAGTGGHVLSSSGLPSSSRTIAVNAEGDVVFQIMATAPGDITFTVTSGTATSTVKLLVANPEAATGRTVAIAGAKEGTANAAAVPVTVSIKDRFGNGVQNAVLTISATGVGVLAGGVTTQSYTTDSTGTFTFLATSLNNDGGAATFTARSSNATDVLSAAGRVGSTTVDSTLAAGVGSASLAITFAPGENAAAANAQAALDAAAEATDAANAATDAANAAAEAADAATAAAQDAADAVAALSTQVSEMIDALKKQITALTNLVIKIQKKVKP